MEELHVDDIVGEQYFFITKHIKTMRTETSNHRAVHGRFD